VPCALAREKRRRRGHVWQGIYDRTEGSDSRECRWFPLARRASPASARGSHAAYQPTRATARSLRSAALHSAPYSVTTGRAGHGALEPRGRGDGPAWRDVPCQGCLPRLSLTSICRARGRARSFFSSRGTKRKNAWQRKKRTAFLCLRRPGRGETDLHCETRSLLPGPSPPWTLPSHPRSGGLLAARR
jgi:hypothetical protein